jgi:hypothetical protein
MTIKTEKEYIEAKRWVKLLYKLLGAASLEPEPINAAIVGQRFELIEKLEQEMAEFRKKISLP